MKISYKSLSETTAITLSIVLGLIMLTNGVVMLLDPVVWYTKVPGVARTGAFNQHFIRDIGMLYLLIGAGLTAGALCREKRLILWGGATIWLSAHAAFHVWEVLTGLCSPSVFIESFTGVFIPAVISAGLTAWTWRKSALTTPKKI